MQQRADYEELKEEDEIQLYRAPDIANREKVQSFLITLIDGTGSMAEEYDSIVKAHNQVFGYLGNNQLRYQWDEQIRGKEKLHNFLPFRDARGGNISLTFKCLFHQLLNGQYPKNITIVFISDGVEPYDYHEIESQVQQMKQQHLIQFISVAVGEQFPNNISNDLRDNIQNQNLTCPPVFEAKRKFVWTEDGMGRPKQEILDEFKSIFNKIKDLLEVTKEFVRVSSPAYQSFAQEEPSDFIDPASPFYTNKKHNGELKVQDTVVQPENHPSLLCQIVKNTVQEVLIQSSTLNKAFDSKDKFSQVQNKVEKILTQSSGIFQEEHKKEKKQLGVLLDVIDEIAVGNIDLKNVNQVTMTELQANLENPDAVMDFIDQKAIAPQRTPQQQIKQVKMKFEKIKIGCFVRCKGIKKEQNLVEQIEETVFESLNEMKNSIKQGKQVIHDSLQKIYDQYRSFTLTEKDLKTFYKINEVLKLIDQLHQDVSSSEAIQFLDQCIKLKNNFSKLPTSINECQHLPSILKSMLNLNTYQNNNQILPRMSFLIDKEPVKPAYKNSYLTKNQDKFSVRNFFVTDSNKRSCQKFECSTFRQAMTKMTNMMRSFTYSYIF